MLCHNHTHHRVMSENQLGKPAERRGRKATGPTVHSEPGQRGCRLCTAQASDLLYPSSGQGQSPSVNHEFASCLAPRLKTMQGENVGARMFYLQFSLRTTRLRGGPTLRAYPRLAHRALSGPSSSRSVQAANRFRLLWCEQHALSFGRSERPRVDISPDSILSERSR